MKRRFLVLTDEAARHPLRSRLAPEGSLQRASLGVLRAQRLTAQDLREFLLAYCACFLAVSLYIA